jgi:hypothetical protein
VLLNSPTKTILDKILGIALNLGTPFEEKQGQSAIGI